MFDEAMYITFLEAAFTILSNNGQTLPLQFREGFMFDHDPKNGRQAEQGIRSFYNFVVDSVRRLNGNNTIRDNAQLFDIVGSYVQNIYQLWINQQRGSFNQGGGFGGMSNGGFSSMSTQSPFGQSRSLSLGQQTPVRVGPSSHLMDDTIPPRIQPQPDVVAPLMSVGQPIAVAIKDDTTMSSFSINPLDEFPENGVDFNQVPGNGWGGERPSDNVFVVQESNDYVSPDNKYVISETYSKSRLVFNDPFEVVKKFFSVVPESLMAKHFAFDIEYDHLEKINIPTSEFVDIREFTTKFIHQMISGISTYANLIEFVSDRSYSSWKSISKYLVKHINRALYLKFRIVENPAIYIQISDLEDLNDLFAATFTSSLLKTSDSREKLKRIVAQAIHNALSENSTLMFEKNDDFDWGVDIMKTSSAFPDVLQKVYPSKVAIPSWNGQYFKSFIQAMRDRELSRRSYVLSRRSVVVTNILGQNVLPNLRKDPIFITGRIPSLLNNFAIDNYWGSRHKPLRKSNNGAIYTKEQNRSFFSDDLDEFYKSNELDDDQVQIRDHYQMSDNDYVDRIIFATQFKSDPFDYLTALDVFSTIDSPSSMSKVIIAKHPIKTLKVV